MPIQKKILSRLIREANDNIIKIIKFYLGEEGLRQRSVNKTEYVGLCPFHSEKTPSFTVTIRKQFYNCFGCGAHGHAIRFIMEYEGVSFVQAARKAARIIGFYIPNGRTNLVRARRRNRNKKKDKYWLRQVPVISQDCQEINYREKILLEINSRGGI